ncbi:MAG: YgeY family selenium metabolism-linked hydrolase [Chloroflexi bacterium]|nr:YgeY family selenium metabolism-linked hydrolase [Chloroflexota bacterium]
MGHVQKLQQSVYRYRERIVQFMREICAIPSMHSMIGPVGERIQTEMRWLGYDEVRYDKMGNTLGRIGHGPRVLVYDSHIDTVGVGDPNAWAWDPFEGKVEDGVFYARGAGDEKGSTPGMVYGLSLARDLGLLDGWTVYYFGNMEEWCDGLAPKAFVEADPAVRPDYVCIGEATRMQVFRGHKGRLEMHVVAKGVSAHAASNHLGDNAIYKLLPVIAGVREMEPALGDHPFLGHGKITVTDMHVHTPSVNAVPDKATICIDRRMTFGEAREQVMGEVQALIPAADRGTVTVQVPRYEQPSYTGFTLSVDKYFPAWALEADHRLVRAGQETRRRIGLADAPSGKWSFSTNGTYWVGVAGIPAIGFAPGDEQTAHTVRDCVPLDDLVKATEFYALLPWLLAQIDPL